MSTSEALRLTIATPYLPYPEVAHGGGHDLFRLIRALGARHQIRLVTFVDAAQAAHAEEIRPYVSELRLVWPATSWRQRARRFLVAARRGRWSDLGRRADREMRRAIGVGPLDVLHCAWTEMGRYLTAAPPGTVRVLEEVDVRFLVDGAARLSLARRRRRRRQELAYCREADLVLARSHRDLASLQEALPGLQGLILPPAGHLAELASLQPGDSLAGRVLFVGAMDRARNQAAARWLVHTIWPLVRRACPEARLRIVGANPPDHILALGRAPGVTVTGWVADLGREYALSRVVVAPMRSEAGALNKVLDGLAAGRPVVATRRANAGIDAPPEAICIADEAETFAAAVARLLQEDGTWQHVGAAGRRHVRAAFDWTAAVARYEAELLARVTALRQGKAHV
jgi:polysaccharide biosynthesis protein PslH